MSQPSQNSTMLRYSLTLQQWVAAPEEDRIFFDEETKFHYQVKDGKRISVLVRGRVLTIPTWEPDIESA